MTLWHHLGAFFGALAFLFSVVTARPAGDSTAPDFQINYPALHAGAQRVSDEADAFLAKNTRLDPQTGQTITSAKFFFCGHRGWIKSSFALRRILLFVRRTGLPAAWYAPTYKPITDSWENLFKKALGAENFDKWMNRSEGILRIPGCGSIHFYSLVDPSNAAGPTYPFIVIDEAGGLQDNVFESIIDPIAEKAMVSYQYSEVWCIGTPNREGRPKNDFWFNLMLALRGTEPDWMGWHVPLPAKVHNATLVPMASPYAHPGYSFERALRGYKKAKRPKAWRIEWLCEFIADDGGQFEQDAIQAQCVLPAVGKKIPIRDTSLYKDLRQLDEAYEGEFFEVYFLQGYQPNEASHYRLACDIGVTTDLTAIGVLDLSTMEMVYFHHFLPFGKDRWFLVKEAIAMAARLFEDRFLVDVGGAGAAIPEAMRLEYGITVEPFSYGINKEEVLNHTSALLEGGLLWLFDLEPIKTELDMMQRTVRASGKGFSIAAAKGGHDDIPTMLGQATYEVTPPPARDTRPGREQTAMELYGIGTTAESSFMRQDDGSIVIIDEAGYGTIGGFEGLTDYV